ncbi:MAG: hypothetical protein AB7P00_36975 [Sandaracinaceae bacterium]
MIDFRTGAQPAKRLYIHSFAKREGVTKDLTLVEKEEVSSWTRVGFVREGTIPGFYKRSDGHLCGCLIGDKTASIEVTEAGVRAAERTINHAKKNAREVPEDLTMVSTKMIDEAAAMKARDEVWRRDKGLNSFDPFGREADRMFMEATAPRGRANHLAAEYQDCFGHSLVEVLRPPEDDLDVLAVTQGLRVLSQTLKDRGIVSAFGFTPAGDIGIATAYCAAGFRKTGLLAGGIYASGQRSDAILWTQKLSNPTDDMI